MARDDRAAAAASRARISPRAAIGALLALALSAGACTTGSVLSLEPSVDVGAATAAVPRREGRQSMAPSGPLMASYPRFDQPAEPDPMSAEEIDCRRDLKRLRVQFTEMAPIDEGGACRIDHPVEMSAIGSVELKPAAIVTCAMARSFASWTKEELVPSARRRYFSGVKTIHQGSSYSCRNIRGSRTASEHSKGNAIDVMRIELNNEKDIKVKRPGLFAFRQRSLLNNVRADACGYFSTVLGPGYDRDHKDHFHFDIKERRNGYVACK
jgi:hypothetical protein